MRTGAARAQRNGAIILLLIALLAAGIVMVCGKTYRENREKITENEDRIDYLFQLGWTAEPTPITEQIVLLPDQFPPVLAEYNSLQLQQGYDLRDYSGKEVEMYVYRILNYPQLSDSGDVYACLYIYRGKVIGGDIHSASLTGFMEGLRKQQTNKMADS